jgi:uncharacterized protein (TIGR04255 family)
VDISISRRADWSFNDSMPGARANAPVFLFLNSMDIIFKWPCHSEQLLYESARVLPMTARESFKIDVSRRFEHLPAAPIVEAVIHWSARAERNWDPASLRKEITERLPDYPVTKPQTSIKFESEGALDEQSAVSTSRLESGWHGYRIETSDNTQIAQFNRDGLVFSRLRPYPDWEAFEREARRLWRVFVELASPSQIQRLGVRFINRIPLSSVDEIPRILCDPPTRPVNLPLSSFLYQSRFEVPGESMAVNIMNALPEQPDGRNDSGLIVDIDVFTQNPMICDERRLDDLLPRMRSIKNAVFFALLNDAALQPFRESSP